MILKLSCVSRLRYWFVSSSPLGGDEIDRDGIAFLSLTQNIDTRTPEGRKWYIDTASWAEYERAMISRRTKLKMADAKRRGVKLGRPSCLTTKAAYRAFMRIERGDENITSCAKKLGISRITLTRTFKRLKLNTGKVVAIES